MVVRVVQLVGLLASVLAGESWAQSNAGPSTADRDFGTDEIPRIEIALADPADDVTVWGNLRLVVALVAPASSGDIGFTDVCVIVPPRLAMVARRGDKVLDRCAILEATSLDGAIKRKDFEPIEFEPARLNEKRFLDLVSLLSHQSRSEIVTVSATYFPLARKEEQSSIESHLRVRVDSHPLSMFVGALFGSLLAASLLVSVRVAGGAGTNSGSLCDAFRGVAGRCFRGAVVAIIVILLAKTTAELRMPVSIDVHDFYGGVLLGLFGDAVAMAIRRWINNPETDTSQARTQQEQGTTADQGSRSEDAAASQTAR